MAGIGKAGPPTLIIFRDIAVKETNTSIRADDRPFIAGDSPGSRKLSGEVPRAMHPTVEEQRNKSEWNNYNLLATPARLGAVVSNGPIRDEFVRHPLNGIRIASDCLDQTRPCEVATP